MLESQQLKPFHWYHIFLFLSMDLVDPYLHLIEFPLQSALKEIKPIARNFLQSYNDIYPAIYVRSDVNEVIIQLLKETFENIESQIGQESFRLFYEWVNKLQILEDLSFSMDIIWRYGITELPDNLAEFPEQQLSQIKTLVSNYRTDIFNVNMALDVIDESANKSEWDKKAYSIYRHEGTEEEELEMSPLHSLWGMIYDVKIRSTLLDIENHLSQAELALITNWVSWAVEEQHIVSKVENLPSILKQLHY